MTSTRNLKRASIPSIVAIVLCFAMLLGTTYAWFTDTVTSSGNAISTGDFQVALQILDADGNWVDTAAREENGAATTANTPIFAEQNWEPGASSVVKVLRVVNEGTIDMKWKAQIIDGGTKHVDGVTAVTVNLADVIDVYFAWDVEAYPTEDVTTTWTKIGTLTECINGDFSTSLYGTLTGDDDDATPDTFKSFGVALKMQETATSEYENLTASFDVKVISTQAVATEWPGENNVQAPTTSATNNATGVSAAAVSAPAGVKLADGADELVLNVANATEADANVTIQNGQSRIDLDIDLEGLATDNTTPVTVTLTIDKNLENVVLYHDGEQIASTYDPATGILTFQTATFSPFTVVYGEVETEPEVTEPEPEVTEPETEPETEPVQEPHADAIATNGDSYCASTIVNGNTVTIKATGEIKWLPAAGTGAENNWVGFVINLPEGEDGSKVTIVRPDGETRIWNNIKDNETQANLYWGFANKEETSVSYTIDWNGDNTVDLTVVIDILEATLEAEPSEELEPVKLSLAQADGNITAKVGNINYYSSGVVDPYFGMGGDNYAVVQLNNVDLSKYSQIKIQYLVGGKKDAGTKNYIFAITNTTDKVKANGVDDEHVLSYAKMEDMTGETFNDSKYVTIDISKVNVGEDNWYLAWNQTYNETRIYSIELIP